MSLVPSPLDNLLAEHSNIKLEVKLQRERAERCEAAYEEVRGLLADMHREMDMLRALLREAQDRSVYLAAPATDDHSISLRERIDAALGDRHE